MIEPDETRQPRNPSPADEVLPHGWRRQAETSASRPAFWCIVTVDDKGRDRRVQPMSHYWGVFFGELVAKSHADYQEWIREGGRG
jgi:hypothetical protein